ncbi:hypothetical protein [Aeromonas schubertii]|uniref:hypothetical protein n=1 Tax=Aeromonas schubertii TaxID=652 RepID=UPI001187314F|nr:hypothetical protein [Aeromonas schubertii]
MANCRFGVAGGSAAWDSAAVMALRNDATAQTVWTKAYSTLGTSGPQAGCFDLSSGYYYVFTTTASELRLWRIRLSDGQATQIGSDTGVKLPGYRYGSVTPQAMLCRFISSNVIEIIYYSGANNGQYYLCSRATIDVTTGVFTQAVQFNAMGYIASLESFAEPSSSNNASVQYVTKDGRASLCFTTSSLLDVPVAESGSNGGNRGAIRTVVVTRGGARCTLSINDDGYHIPYRYDGPTSITAQVMMTDGFDPIDPDTFSRLGL